MALTKIFKKMYLSRLEAEIYFEKEKWASKMFEILSFPHHKSIRNEDKITGSEDYFLKKKRKK